MNGDNSISIVITAGGTAEPIDGVRKITNTSTGRLCACIYDALASQVAELQTKLQNQGKDQQRWTVHYVASANALRPQPNPALPVTFYAVSDVASCMAVIQQITIENRIDFFIHGMAVSDFTRGYLVEQKALANELVLTVDEFYKKQAAALAETAAENLPALLADVISQVLAYPASAIPAASKLSSQNDLMLALVRTPKIITQIKKWCPNTFLIGFKLLNGASDTELFQAATLLAETNSCDLVLANDAARIDEHHHVGLLVRQGQVIARYQTRQEIASGLASQILTAHSFTKNGGAG